ncbi:uncharacterized protein LOC103128050 [Erinaceus europaeus]|uniref:Uncharacterized protein LOC103128050 n=1 Tax=Erinaceus europaeus TaxID=9365 RepID=A0A1S3AQV3_ERIEU|nr:uncharacterized protein LOC103128050 [Erinaceus europaeus]
MRAGPRMGMGRELEAGLGRAGAHGRPLSTLGPPPAPPPGRTPSSSRGDPPAAGTAPPPLPRWWPAAPRLPAVKLESLKRWNEERGLWCEKGLQVLVTTVGAFAAFGLMTIAISTDYWLYTRALLCNASANLSDDGPPHRPGAADKKDPGGLTHSGLWRICCLEVAPNMGPNIAPNMGPNIASNVEPNIAPNMAPNMGPNMAPNMGPNIAPTWAPT